MEWVGISLSIREHVLYRNVSTLSSFFIMPIVCYIIYLPPVCTPCWEEAICPYGDEICNRYVHTNYIHSRAQQTPMFETSYEYFMK